MHQILSGGRVKDATYVEVAVFRLLAMALALFPVRISLSKISIISSYHGKRMVVGLAAVYGGFFIRLASSKVLVYSIYLYNNNPCRLGFIC